MSDILIASPLGLRTLLADEFDFLCSIEVLIMDQTDILYMQVISFSLYTFTKTNFFLKSNRIGIMLFKYSSIFTSSLESSMEPI